MSFFIFVAMLINFEQALNPSDTCQRSVGQSVSRASGQHMLYFFLILYVCLSVCLSVNLSVSFIQYHLFVIIFLYTRWSSYRNSSFMLSHLYTNREKITWTHNLCSEFATSVLNDIEEMTVRKLEKYHLFFFFFFISIFRFKFFFKKRTRV